MSLVTTHYVTRAKSTGTDPISDLSYIIDTETMLKEVRSAILPMESVVCFASFCFCFDSSLPFKSLNMMQNTNEPEEDINNSNYNINTKISTY